MNEEPTLPADGPSPEWRSTTRGTEPPTLPQRIGEYRITALLGEGGMGFVLRGRSDKLNRDVAIKLMKPEVAANPDSRGRFLREGRGMAAVKNDHVIDIYHDGEHAGMPYLVMPLLEGETLQNRLTRVGVIPAGRVIRIGTQIADGLAAAHAEGLIHRDIKPSNIWLEAGTDRVKILDFGLVRDLAPPDGELTPANAVMGTPNYMSPEQSEGRPVDPRSDLFSLGTVLYRMAGGESPFRGKGFLDTLTAIRSHRPPPVQELNGNVPAELSNLIMRLLEKDPADRPRTAGEVLDRLNTLSAREPLPPTEQRILPDAGTAPRKRGWGIVAAALVVVGLLAGAGIAIWDGGRPRPEVREVQSEPGPPPPVVGIDGEIDVVVRKKEQGGEAAPPMRLHQHGVLPLKPGDRIEVEASLTSDKAYMYIVWLEANGRVSPLYPWKDWEWDRNPNAEEAATILTIPESELSEGNSGVEGMLLMVRPTPLPEGADGRLAEVLSAWPEQDGLGRPEERFWLENGRLVIDEQHRGRPNVRRENLESEPLVRLSRLMSGPLREWFPHTRAVCYAFQGE